MPYYREYNTGLCYPTQREYESRYILGYSHHTHTLRESEPSSQRVMSPVPGHTCMHGHQFSDESVMHETTGNSVRFDDCYNLAYI